MARNMYIVFSFLYTTSCQTPKSEDLIKITLGDRLIITKAMRITKRI